MKMEGAEARILPTEFLGIRAVMKERVSKAYRVKELDRAIISQRTRMEARIMALASSSGIMVPALLFVENDSIWMERLDGQTLNWLIGKRQSLGRNMATLGGYLGKLHNANIAHGDYTPANALVSRGKVYVIDFGLSSITNSVEDKALDLLLMKRSVDARLFSPFLAGYKKSCKGAKEILGRLAEIEKRGRYQNRSLDG